jgi:hypothetical protein
MRKETLECDLCGGEIKNKDTVFYYLEVRVLPESAEPIPLDGPKEMDICRYCLKNLIEPLGKWPKEKPSDPVLAPEDDIPEILDDPLYF